MLEGAAGKLDQYADTADRLYPWPISRIWDEESWIGRYRRVINDRKWRSIESA
jgi:hypothetical protein